MKKIFIFLLFIFIFFRIFSELSNIDPNFYNYDARAMAMGGAHVALTNRPVSVIWNPAGLNKMTGKHNLAFDNSSLHKLVSYNFFGYGYKFGPNFSIAKGITYCGDAALSELVIYFSGAVNGNYLDKKLMSLPEFFRNFNFGMNLKYFGSFFGNNSDGAYFDENALNHQVTGSAHGFGLDLGWLGKISETQSIGLFWRNPLNNLWWKSENEIGTAKSSYSEDIPTAIIFGYALEKKNITFSLDYDKSHHQDTEDEIKTGFEIKLFKNIFALRTGYAQELFTAENKRFSMGTGFQFNIWKKTAVALDLAYQIFYEWEGHNALRFSCNLIKQESFGLLPK